MNTVRTEKVLPFLKWAGGKRWFADRHTHLLPDGYDRYVEPFLGGGALFFATAPERAVLSDLNIDLIATYEVARDFPTDLAERLRRYHERHSRDTYYTVREKKPSDKIELAAWFLYLNRTCWNGLYRVNLRNVFNVPIGTKTDVVLPSDDFEIVSQRLAAAKIQCCDFETTIDTATDGDFVFVDPPYTVKHNENGFVKYNDRIFSWDDQVRLRDAVARASQRGAKVLVTNANHASIRELYRYVGSLKPISRASVLAGNSAYRASVEELAIRTWI